MESGFVSVYDCLKVCMTSLSYLTSKDSIDNIEFDPNSYFLRVFVCIKIKSKSTKKKTKLETNNSTRFWCTSLQLTQQTSKIRLPFCFVGKLLRKSLSPNLHFYFYNCIMDSVNSKETVKQPEWFPPSEETGQYLGIHCVCKFASLFIFNHL